MSKRFAYACFAGLEAVRHKPARAVKASARSVDAPPSLVTVEARMRGHKSLFSGMNREQVEKLRQFEGPEYAGPTRYSGRK